MRKMLCQSENKTMDSRFFGLCTRPKDARNACIASRFDVHLLTKSTKEEKVFKICLLPE